MPSLPSISHAFSRLKPFGLFLFALLFLNRALLVSPLETANGDSEINSVAELFVQWATGHSNGIDEDGDSQETCNVVKISTPVFSPQVLPMSDIFDLSAKITEDFTFPTKENIPPKPPLGTLEQPPQV